MSSLSSEHNPLAIRSGNLLLTTPWPCSSLSTAFCRHLLTLVSLRSFYTSSSRLHIGLPLLLFPSGLLSNTFLTILPWSILATCPIHSILFFLISTTVSRSLYSSLSSWLVLVFHIPCSATGPYKLLNIFLFDVPSPFISMYRFRQFRI